MPDGLVRPQPKVFPIAVGIGLMAGITEVLILTVQKFVFDETVWRSLDSGWTVPVVYTVILGTLGFAYDRASQFLPRLLRPRLGLLGVMYIASFSVLFLFYPHLHKYAAMTLALGIAIEVSRRALESKRFCLSRRRSLAGMAGLVAGLAVGIRGSHALSEGSQLRRIRQQPAQGPNVLLIVLDTVRASSMSAYGYHRPTTPFLNQWSQQAQRFARAYAPASWTLPSHASMFTGRHAHQLSTDWLSPLDDKDTVLAEFYSSQRYLTAGFVANKGYCSAEFGLHRGFAHYEDYGISLQQMLRDTSLGRYVSDSRRLRRAIRNHQILGRKHADELVRNFGDWLAEREDGRPFFAFLNFFDAHAPYIPPEPFASAFGGFEPQEYSPHVHIRDVDATGLASMVSRYDASLAYLDSQLEVLFRSLEERGLTENTLIAVVGDHGEEFGEHGIFDHGNSLYAQSLHVPLFMRLPSRVPAGHVISQPVSLRDLATTIVELTHGKGASPFPGQSMVGLWDGSGTSATHPIVSEVRFAKGLPDWLPVSRGTMHSLMLEDMKLIRNGDGRVELYDMQGDPRELSDLSQTAGGHETARRLADQLDDILST